MYFDEVFDFEDVVIFDCGGYSGDFNFLGVLDICFLGFYRVFCL